MGVVGIGVTSQRKKVRMMKLIIDIDEKIIQQAKHCHDLPYDDYVVRVAEAIANGTPIPWGYTIGLAGGFDKTLDDIKTEIDEKLKEPEYLHEGEDWQNGLIMAEIIIDKHTDDFHYDGEADIKSISTPTGITFDNYKVLEDIKAEIREEKEFAYADFERYKVECLGQDWEDAYDSLPQDDYRYGMERCLEIINKHIGERN